MNNSFADLRVRDDGPTAALLCGVRVVLANDTEVEMMEAGRPWPWRPHAPLSPSNERAVLERLRARGLMPYQVGEGGILAELVLEELGAAASGGERAP